MIVGILLAAGQSRRFGGDKLLRPLDDGTPVALRSAEQLAAVVDRVIVVVPPRAAPLMHLLADSGARLQINGRAAQGMGTSLACGVCASAEADGWLIARADMPFMAPATLATVAAALRAGAPLVAPSHDGRSGHPVGFRHRYYGDLANLDGDAGAHFLLRRDRRQLVAVPVDDEGIHLDIDVPGDLQRARRQRAILSHSAR